MIIEDIQKNQRPKEVNPKRRYLLDNPRQSKIPRKFSLTQADEERVNERGRSKEEKSKENKLIVKTKYEEWLSKSK